MDQLVLFKKLPDEDLRDLQITIKNYWSAVFRVHSYCKRNRSSLPYCKKRKYYCCCFSLINLAAEADYYGRYDKEAHYRIYLDGKDE